MKKDQPRQDRRRRALERLTIKPIAPLPAGASAEQRAAHNAQYDAYVNRKLIEQAALRAALSV